MLTNLDILIFDHDPCSEISSRAVWFAARSCAKLGAQIYVSGSLQPPKNPFYDCDAKLIEVPDPQVWAAQSESADRKRILLCPTSVGVRKATHSKEKHSAVYVETELWETEATLFAGSGIATLLGAPDRVPLVPRANYAAHSIGFSALTAICVLHAGQRLNHSADIAVVNGLNTLVWANWKAVEAGSRGSAICREGDQAEWPVLACQDGHVALIYTENEWARLVSMVGDDRLKHEHLQTFAGRADNRSEYVGYLREWAREKPKSALEAMFLEWGVPGAAVLTPDQLSDDPLLKSQDAFEVLTAIDGTTLLVPKVPLNTVAVGPVQPQSRRAHKPNSRALPLAGLKVLDFGIITAGAGISATLADFGAEVIKIESPTYPDPFRMWAGASKTDSSVFKFNNRNKQGVALNLKTDEGRAAFLELVADADIVLENFRRGVLDRLGMTFDVLRAANPTILLASISGMGHDGPGSKLATFGSTLEANSGFSALTIYDDGLPQVSGRNLNFPDQTVCLYAGGILAAAAAECRLSDTAKHIDISQRDCTIYQLGDWLAQGRSPETELSHTNRTFSTLDGRFVALAWCDADEISTRLGFEPNDEAALAKWLERTPFEEANLLFSSHNSAMIECMSGLQLFQDPRFHEQRVFSKSPNGELVKGFAFDFLKSPMCIHLDAPKIGEHNSKLLPEVRT